MHLRRGDFVEHCENLGHWGASFNAFASFPSFPDPWEPPEGSEEDRMSVYMRRCLPTIAQVVEKVDAVRAAVGSSDGGLQNVYVMTNADEAWLGELKDALRVSGGWERIATSRDMVWTPEQKYVSQATDMMIGQRAQVFIGNGVRVHTRVLVLANEPIVDEPYAPSCFAPVFEHVIEYCDVAYGEGHDAAKSPHVVKSRPTPSSDYNFQSISWNIRNTTY